MHLTTQLAILGEIHRLLEQHRVLTKELQLDLVARFGGIGTLEEGQMFDTQRATTDSVGFVFTLFTANTQREFVDDEHGDTELAQGSIPRRGADLGGVISTDLVDAALQLDSLGVLLEVRLCTLYEEQKERLRVIITVVASGGID